MDNEKKVLNGDGNSEINDLISKEETIKKSIPIFDYKAEMRAIRDDWYNDCRA